MSIVTAQCLRINFLLSEIVITSYEISAKENMLEERKLTSQSPSITVEFSVQYNLKITSVIYLFIYFRHCILLFVLIEACFERLYDIIVDFMLDCLCYLKVGFMLSLAGEEFESKRFAATCYRDTHYLLEILQL